MQAGHHGTQAFENSHMSLECVTLSSGAHIHVIDVCCPCSKHPSPSMPVLKFVLKFILLFFFLFSGLQLCVFVYLFVCSEMLSQSLS